MNAIYLDRIKSFEGFTPEAKPDYAQLSNGYGTRALYPGERIDRAEAERRFAEEIAQAREFVERHASSLDEGTKAALTSLTFNAGTRWLSSGLGEAVRQGNLDAVRERFVQYTKAGGKELPGLVSRRLAEVSWIGNGPGAHRQSGANAVPPPVASLETRSIAEAAPSPAPADAAASPLMAAAPAITAAYRDWRPADLSPATRLVLAFAALELATLRRSGDDRDGHPTGV